MTAILRRSTRYCEILLPGEPAHSAIAAAIEKLLAWAKHWFSLSSEMPSETSTSQEPRMNSVDRYTAIELAARLAANRMSAGHAASAAAKRAEPAA